MGRTASRTRSMTDKSAQKVLRTLCTQSLCIGQSWLLTKSILIFLIHKDTKVEESQYRAGGSTAAEPFIYSGEGSEVSHC